MSGKATRYLRIVLPALLALTAVLAGCAPTPTPTPAPAAAPPSVRILSPAAGATVAAGNVQVTVEIKGFELVAPGGAAAAGKGHLHYYMDVTIPTAAAKPAVTAAGTYKVSPGTTSTWENVPAGSHTFGVQLVNNDHTPLSPPVTAEITITVAAEAAPPPYQY